jgi:hypothetical protein
MNPKGMTQSINAANQTPTLAEPTAIETIRPKGYRWQLENAQKNRIPHKETFTDDSRILQIGNMAYVCFNDTGNMKLPRRKKHH